MPPVAGALTPGANARSTASISKETMFRHESRLQQASYDILPAALRLTEDRLAKGRTGMPFSNGGRERQGDAFRQVWLIAFEISRHRNVAKVLCLLEKPQ
jgi:hypothetical protein